MKKLIIGVIVLCVSACASQDQNLKQMKKATIVEVVMWDAAEGISTAEAQEAAKKLNEFVSQQAGFVGRKTGISKEARFVDLVYWTDLESALAASEKAMKTEALMPLFGSMKQEGMLFQHFELFNELEVE